MQRVEIGNAVLYLGNCLDVLPRIDRSLSALITDPPYGMNYKPLRGGDGSKRFSESVIGDNEPFDPSPFLSFDSAIMFGANWYADKLPPSGGWIVWDKTPRGAKNGFKASHAELAWTNVRTSVVKFSLQWGGEAHGGEPHFHPTQKPVPLMEFCIRQAGTHETVFDPFMGSGSTGVAAVNLGRKFIGCELDPSHFETAVKRIELTLSQPQLFKHTEMEVQ